MAQGRWGWKRVACYFFFHSVFELDTRFSLHVICRCSNGAHAAYLSGTPLAGWSSNVKKENMRVARKCHLHPQGKQLLGSIVFLAHKEHAHSIKTQDIKQLPFLTVTSYSYSVHFHLHNLRVRLGLSSLIRRGLNFCDSKKQNHIYPGQCALAA